MTDKTQRLIDERNRLTKKIEFMNVEYTGKELVKQRIKDINKELQLLQPP